MKRVLYRFAVIILVLASSSVLTACEEFEKLLQQLTPEQRAYYKYYWSQETFDVLPRLEKEEIADGEALELEPAKSFLETVLVEDTCTELLVGPPRGLACLHCTEPEAKYQARVLGVTLFRSCLKNLAMNFLVDGTFAYYEEVLLELVELLTSQGREASLIFYLANGSTQRRWSTTEIDSFATRMSPEEFRSRIQDDFLLRFEYQRIVQRLLPVLKFASERGAEIYLVPMLEDNLSDKSFNSLYQLTLETLPESLPLRVGRNSCLGCYAGNQGEVPLGAFEEIHTTSGFVSLKDGVLTNDGRTYFYSQVDEFPEANELKLSDIAPLRDAAARQANVFILWSAERQGLSSREHGGFTFRHPRERSYQIPSISERQAIIDFLREGLEPAQ